MRSKKEKKIPSQIPCKTSLGICFIPYTYIYTFITERGKLCILPFELTETRKALADCCNCSGVYYDLQRFHHTVSTIICIHHNRIYLPTIWWISKSVWIGICCINITNCSINPIYLCPPTYYNMHLFVRALDVRTDFYFISRSCPDIRVIYYYVYAKD